MTLWNVNLLLGSLSGTWDPSLWKNHQERSHHYLPVCVGGWKPNFIKHQLAKTDSLITLTNLPFVSSRVTLPPAPTSIEQSLAFFFFFGWTPVQSHFPIGIVFFLSTASVKVGLTNKHCMQRGSMTRFFCLLVLLFPRCTFSLILMHAVED